MQAKKTSFSFTGKIVTIDRALMPHVVFLPSDIVKQLPKGRVRVQGTFNEAPFSLAVLNEKDGGRFFSMSNPLRKAAKVNTSGIVAVSFKLVDADLLEIPEELEAVLAQDDEGRTAWDKITIGMQRSLVHYITSVKNVDSRIKRALFLVNKVKHSSAYPQKPSEGDEKVVKKANTVKKKSAVKKKAAKKK